jgi:APA family basic amino acid/polyamine antiporter
MNRNKGKRLDRKFATAAADGIAALPAQERPTTSLHRTLGRWQLTLMGVSNAVGAGVLVLAGTMAANYAGPAAALSFVIAGLVCLLVALCYAELAAMMPHSGSAYSYAKASLGRFVSWLVGWCLILGYLVAGSAVAVGWSGYFSTFVESFGLRIPSSYLASPIRVTPDFTLAASGAILNVPAVLIVLLCALALIPGVRESARLNTVMVLLKLAAIVLFISVGVFFVKPSNWQPFIPVNTGQWGHFGLSGIFSGAVLAFFAFTGFEVISTSTQEAKRPARDIPFALLASFCLCAVLYIATTLVMTGLVPYLRLDHPSPMALAIDEARANLGWLSFVISALIVIGLPSAVLASLYGQSRIFVVMSEDNLLPRVFAQIHRHYRTPLAGTLIIGLVAMLIAGVVPLEVLGELVSMGLLFCFTVVCLSVIVLRRRAPLAERPFRAPLYPLTPVLGVASCVYLIFSLPVGTWLRLAVWITVGGAVYLFVGKASPEPPHTV